MTLIDSKPLFFKVLFDFVLSEENRPLFSGDASFTLLFAFNV